MTSQQRTILQLERQVLALQIAVDELRQFLATQPVSLVDDKRAGGKRAVVRDGRLYWEASK